MKRSMLLSTLTLGLVGLAGSALAAKEPPTTLQIGVTQRVPDAECKIKSQNGDKLSMHYTGKLWDGKQFDSSVGRGPFDFVIGSGQVIKGWEQGLLDMCIGEKRKLKIPPHLGYGDRGAGGAIPGGATLVFDVELLDILGPRAAALKESHSKDEL
ncbi:hypothetical protein K437DRAFT_254934 [Tilletiaria anomala UBC 951]|uniref:peptidylprolyl isomerase n=1 Tax=Tilletiaria anomala (strain ATCC 24038 / CBS 436.72 / UBC 951) TaxID=1037660 RepID=A0A066WFS6_TILAU|nr:uncharacterized protein K437DRAFT_254934 [Tilletiaria anomala UBC 951]KDN51343.1 hypothetical protein K437DRAFT_254934 [Tilletiaria anomala UBC 951]